MGKGACHACNSAVGMSSKQNRIEIKQMIGSDVSQIPESFNSGLSRLENCPVQWISISSQFAKT